jgi:hypothetical protein
VLHGIYLSTRARNLGTKFTFLISLGHTHNHPTSNTLTDITTARYHPVNINTQKNKNV